MRIATLQLNPQLGDFQGNVQRADDILNNAKSVRGSSPAGVEGLKPELLVLPEMALTGYNFPSLEAIKPHLEVAGTGRSAIWARKTAKKLQCKVCVGYPEIEGDPDSDGARYYNSLIVVDEQGEVIHNYRKCFLFFTDDSWANEGNVERGFKQLSFPSRAGTGEEDPVATSFGICMDINPYKFEAPFTDYEFASRVMDSKSQLVILSMAWVSMLDPLEYKALRGGSDADTFNYWLQRLRPLLEREMQHMQNLDGGVGGDKRVVVVFANRAGSEPATDPEKPTVIFAGTSTILAVTQRNGSSELEVEILLWDQLGAAEEGVCFADTTAEPKMVLGLRK